MNTLTSEKINEIRDSVDIVDIISNYVSLVPKGKNYFGICPFHDDNNPSMSVSRDKKIYKCFSCGATGSVFKFVMDIENISFKEAVSKIAETAGIKVDIGQIKKVKNNTILHDIYDLSLKFYINNINTKEGREAKEYLKQRSIDEDIIKEFQIGLALSNNKNLSNILKKRFDKKEILKTGLIYENDFGLLDLYHDRIMFPLYDLNGQAVAYSGRKYHEKDLQDKEISKYINTRETEIFKKGNLLYNYHKAKEPARMKNQIIVMEGFMDVIRAYTIGVKNAIATMGTAVTKEQANLIKRLGKEVILCFDGDEAGAKATASCSDELISIGVTPKVVRLENNLDPDEYILKEGKEAFLYKVDNPISVMDFKLNYLKKNKNLNNSIDEAKYINDAIKEISKINDDILKEITIKKLVNETNIDENLIREKLNLNKKEIKKIKVNNKTKPIKTNKYELAQRNLLFHMLENPEVIKMYNNKVTYMPIEEYRLLAREISMFYKENGFINIASLIDYTEGDDEIVKTIGKVQTANLDENYTIEEIEDYINAIKDYNIKEETKRIKKQINEEQNPIKKAALAQKIIDLKKGV